jgi:hypothetical protein
VVSTSNLTNLHSSIGANQHGWETFTMAKHAHDLHLRGNGMSDAAIHVRGQEAIAEQGLIHGGTRQTGQAHGTITPRLLDLEAAATYLSVSPWTIRDLEAKGVLPRVRVPLPGGGELRKLLFDKADLDRLIGVWKDAVG